MKLWSGHYRLVYGTTRLLIAPEEPGKPLYEAYEIGGGFDADSIQWRVGEMKVKDLKTGEIKSITVTDWPFSLYEGDKLYKRGILLLSCVFADEKARQIASSARTRRLLAKRGAALLHPNRLNQRFFPSPSASPQQHSINCVPHFGLHSASLSIAGTRLPAGVS